MYAASRNVAVQPVASSATSSAKPSTMSAMLSLRRRRLYCLASGESGGKPSVRDPGKEMESLPARVEDAISASTHGIPPAVPLILTAGDGFFAHNDGLGVGQYLSDNVRR